MRIALVADLHGNVPAVRAVEDDIKRRGVDKIWCLGDIVGKGPDSPDTMDWAVRNCEIVLRGNWDEGVGTLDGKDRDSSAAKWYRRQLGEERVAKLASLPLEHRFVFCGKKARLLHGRNTVPDIVYPDSPIEQRLQFFNVEDKPDIVGYADIHRPFWIQINDTGILFNTGSVGNPLGGNTLANYAIIEGEIVSDTPICHSIISVPYDRDEAIRRTIARADLPNGAAFVNELTVARYSR
ncbi:MAG: metallophosphatase family protein [Oscillospiraceae bacterium]|jgi:predicted phosphodiesterase|nr:metallophosphatase family protein [Oscillospiraceae bacterium]